MVRAKQREKQTVAQHISHNRCYPINQMFISCTFLRASVEYVYLGILLMYLVNWNHELPLLQNLVLQQINFKLLAHTLSCYSCMLYFNSSIFVYAGKNLVGQVNHEVKCYNVGVNGKMLDICLKHEINRRKVRLTSIKCSLKLFSIYFKHAVLTVKMFNIHKIEFSRLNLYLKYNDDNFTLTSTTYKYLS